MKSPDWNVSRETVEFMENEYGSRANKASIGNVGVFSFIETGDRKGAIHGEKAKFKLVPKCNWKNTFLTYML